MWIRNQYRDVLVDCNLIQILDKKDIVAYKPQFMYLGTYTTKE